MLISNHLTNSTVMLTWGMISARQPVTPAVLSDRTRRVRPSCLDSTLPFSTACALFVQTDSQRNAASPVFSSLCAHFTKTWGMASVNRVKNPSAERVGRFALVSLSSFFSHSCKLPLLQLVSFDNHANARGWGYPLAPRLERRVVRLRRKFQSLRISRPNLSSVRMTGQKETTCH